MKLDSEIINDVLGLSPVPDAKQPEELVDFSNDELASRLTDGKITTYKEKISIVHFSTHLQWLFKFIAKNVMPTSNTSTMSVAHGKLMYCIDKFANKINLVECATKNEGTLL